MNNPAVWLLAALAAPCALLAVRYWQRALFAVFVLMVFEGALRKWAFPSAQALLYLVKDAILLAVYLGFILDSRKNLPSPKGVGLIKIVLGIGFVFGCIEVFNPNSPSILVGLMGVKTYFLYAPVAFILPYAIKSREHLFVLIRRYLIMAIPVAVLGFVQIMAGPGSSLNTYVSHSEDSEAVLAIFWGRELRANLRHFFIHFRLYGVSQLYWLSRHRLQHDPWLASQKKYGPGPRVSPRDRRDVHDGLAGSCLYPACHKSRHPLVGCGQGRAFFSNRHAPLRLDTGHCHCGVERISSSDRSIHGARGRRRFVLYANAIIFAVISDHRGALGWACLRHGYRYHASFCLDHNGG